MHIIDMIYYWARTAPNRAAIIQRSMVMSYQGLADGIESISERIDGLNLDKEEPVAVSILNPPFMLATVFALLRNGYSVAPVNSRRAPFIAGAGIRHMIYDKVGQVTSSGRNIRFDPSWLPKHLPASSRTYRKRPAANSSMIFFTSGTTGLPKKLVIPAAALDARLSYPFNFATGAYQKILILPGPATTFGFYGVCEVLNLGKTVSFSLINTALPLINLFGIEAVVAAPAQALTLVEMKNQNPGYRVNSLKAVFIGGGKIDPTSLPRVRAALCRNVINDYGSTEAGTAGLTPFDLVSDSAGAIIFPWVDLEIIDDVDRQMPFGAQGVVRIRSPQLKENLKVAGPDALPDTRDGWFYPGDLGLLDNDRILHLAGRNSDVINRGGFKVSGTRIEEVLQAFPEIKEAATCGILGTSGVEELWIAVVPNGAIDIARIKIHLSEHKDVQLMPDEVIVMDELPRGEAGKVQKPRLRERLLELKRSGG